MARPRSEEARQAALATTVDLLLERGLEGVTFEDVAAASGVAKTTLYRHFGTKQAMLVAAARSCFVQHVTPDTGDLRKDLDEIFVRSYEVEEAHRVGDVIPALLAAAERDADLGALVHAMLEERRRPIRTVLQLAQLRGEIAQELDLDVAVATIIGPFIMRKLIDRLEISDDFRTTTLDLAVAGLRSTADERAGSTP